MKKSIKVISTLLLAIMLVTSIAGTVLAVDPNTVLNGLNGNGNVQTNDLTKVGNNIVTIIQVVGIVIAVIVLLVIGIKYMMGSASEKAEYKKTMIPYIVGAVLIFAGTSLVRVIYSLSTSVSTK
ncbi:MAG: TrbC/VirB2 family protein [Clostridia bacterium]|jgi:type IV secretory pathway VirB2 component (pilin)|nr:TrbC/VirB2 family protein [Clostridia bacterium]CDA59547.1 unknown [Clostridium sp. CAG:245]